MIHFVSTFEITITGTFGKEPKTVAMVVTTQLEESLHPKAEFPTRRTSGHPILRWVELCDGGDSSDAIATQLRKLLTLGCVDVDEAVHVADAEALHAVLWLLLPLRAQNRNPSSRLIVVWYHD